MKYADIPTFQTTMKLIRVSFSTPEKNFAMYRLYSSIEKYQGYLENEKDKLAKKYGTPVEGFVGKYNLTGENLLKYHEEWKKIVEADLPMQIEDPGFTEDDFKGENCSYPSEKEMWPSALDINGLLKFCEKIRKEKKDD